MQLQRPSTVQKKSISIIETDPQVIQIVELSDRLLNNCDLNGQENRLQDENFTRELQSIHQNQMEIKVAWIEFSN